MCLPFYGYSQCYKRWQCEGHIVQRVNDFWPQIDVDWSGPGNQFQTLFQSVLDKGKPRENGVNDAKHNNQLKLGKKQGYDYRTWYLLDKGKPQENGVNDKKHHNQIKVEKKLWL